MKMQEGDRVRIVTVESDYTGCRGTLARAPSEVPLDPSGEPLGYYVAIGMRARVERLCRSRSSRESPSAGGVVTFRTR